MPISYWNMQYSDPYVCVTLKHLCNVANLLFVFIDWVQVYLVDHRRGMVDEDLMFTESQDFGEGFRTVRLASDTLLNMTLMPEEEKSSGGLFHHHKAENQVKEGTPITLDTWHEKEAQLWKIFPLCE